MRLRLRVRVREFDEASGGPSGRLRVGHGRSTQPQRKYLAQLIVAELVNFLELKANECGEVCIDLSPTSKSTPKLTPWHDPSLAPPQHSSNLTTHPNA